MMCLDQNKQTIYYALLQGTVETTDTSGNYTGEYAPSYSDPVAVRMNVSAARGTAETEQFGINERYTKTVVTDDMDCPIAEDSVLWIDEQPETVYTLQGGSSYLDIPNFPDIIPVVVHRADADETVSDVQDTGVYDPGGAKYYSFVLNGSTYYVTAAPPSHFPQNLTDPRIEPPYNYTITRVARSLNSITYAVREVKVSD